MSFSVCYVNTQWIYSGVLPELTPVEGEGLNLEDLVCLVPTI